MREYKKETPYYQRRAKVNDDGQELTYGPHKPSALAIPLVVILTFTGTAIPVWHISKQDPTILVFIIISSIFFPFMGWLMYFIANREYKRGKFIIIDTKAKIITLPQQKKSFPLNSSMRLKKEYKKLKENGTTYIGVCLSLYIDGEEHEILVGPYRKLFKAIKKNPQLSYLLSP